MTRQSLLIEDEHQIYADPPSWEIVAEPDAAIAVAETMTHYRRIRMWAALSVLASICLTLFVLFVLPHFPQAKAINNLRWIVKAFLCMIPGIIIWGRFELNTQWPYRIKRSKIKELLSIAPDGTISLPRKQLTFPADTRGWVELAQDYRMERHLYMSANDRWMSDEQLEWYKPTVEVNLLVVKGNEVRRYAVCGQAANAGESIELTTRLARQLRWPVQIRVGEYIPEVARQPVDEYAAAHGIVPEARLPENVIDDVDALYQHKFMTELKDRITAESESHRRTRVMLIGVTSFICLCAAAIFWHNSSKASEAFQASNWPTVPGVIKFSEVEKQERFLGDSFELYIKYEYEFAGKTVRNDRIGVFKPTFSTKQAAENFLARFKKGNLIDVYCNPAHPQETVLITGQYWEAVLHLLQPFTILTVVVPLWVTTRRRKQE